MHHTVIIIVFSKALLFAYLFIPEAYHAAVDTIIGGNESLVGKEFIDAAGYLRNNF